MFLKLWSINFYLWNHFWFKYVFIFLYKYAIFLSVPAQDDKGLAADPNMGTNVFYIYNK